MSADTTLNQGATVKTQSVGQQHSCPSASLSNPSAKEGSSAIPRTAPASVIRHPGNGQSYEPRHIDGVRSSTDTKATLDRITLYARGFAQSSGSAGSPTKDDINRIKMDRGLRTGFADIKPGDEVVTNYLKTTPPGDIYVYEVEMIREYESNGRPIKVVRRADKEAVMRIIEDNVPQLQPPADGQRRWVSDGDLIWSVIDLFSDMGDKSTVPGTNVTLLHNLSYRNECGQLLDVKDIYITYKTIIDSTRSVPELFDVPAGTPQRKSIPAILLRGLNAFLTNEARQRARHQARQQGNNYVFTSAQKLFSDRDARPLGRNSEGGDLLHCLKGFFLSARPGIDEILLNMNTAFSAFYGTGQTVHAFLSAGTYRGKTTAQKTSLLKGVQVSIKYAIGPPGAPDDGWNPASTRLRFIFTVGEAVDRQECHAPSTTVLGCLKNQASICPNRPPIPRNPNKLELISGCHAIQVARNTQMHPTDVEWVAADQLEIVAYQPFHNQLDAFQTSAMIDQARNKPPQNYEQITTKGLQMFGLDRVSQTNSLIPAFNMSTGADLLRIPGSWLAAPVVHYRKPNDRAVPAPPPRQQQASWNLLTPVWFVATQNPVKELPYIDISGKSHTDPNFQRMLRELEQALQKHGVLAQRNQSPTFTTSQDSSFRPQEIKFARHTPLFEEKIRDTFNSGVPPKQRSSPVLVATEKKDNDLYAYIKRVAELVIGAKTVIVVAKDLHKFDGQKASNIALKYNLKALGTNHVLDKGFNVLRKGGQADTIVIGADVTHPGPGAQEGTPSIAAVVGSTDDNFMHFPGSMRCQRSGKESIIELGDMVKERLIDWAKQHDNRLPNRILFYRDGVSESQYGKLRTFEIPQIQQAFNWAREFLNHYKAEDLKDKTIMDTSRNPWPPVIPRYRQVGDNDDNDRFEDSTGLKVEFELTYVVVGKRHNTRFYPVQGQKMLPGGRKGINGNVQPGLVVDQVITNSYSMDFYLQSHQPLDGTGRSAHYFVIQNNMGLSAKDLQRVTHEFCYAYARATKGVSYCAPAYYADRLCDRGRAYIRHWLTKQGTDPQYRPRPRRTNPLESLRDYHDDIKNTLRDSSYWRTAKNKEGIKYGFTRRNPWHPNLDDIMFYL